VFKTSQELEVMRFANRVSSEAHKEVNTFWQATINWLSFHSFKSGVSLRLSFGKEGDWLSQVGKNF